MNILLIEDSPSEAHLISHALHEIDKQSTLRHVRDGIEALQYLRKQNAYINAVTPDIVLLDINLPKMNGKEILEIIKKDNDLKRIPAIMLSSSSYEEDIRTCYELHSNCYIIKPFAFEGLVMVMKEILDFWGRTATLPKAA